MVNIIPLVITFAIIFIVGGGGGLWLWFKTRPKKQTWTAKVYQVGEGVKPLLKNKDGKIISNIRVNDLIPYIEDTIEKLEKEHGVVVYRLVRLNMSVNPVTADAVEGWGKERKEVSVLIQNETATILKKGYDKTSGQALFRPMPRGRVGLITSEISIKNERLNKSKDILQAITPWIVIGIAMLGLIAIVYFETEASIKRAELTAQGEEELGNAIVNAAEIHRDAIRSMTKGVNDNLGKQPPPTEG